MKIAKICNLPPPAGGAEVLARELAKSLKKKGCDVSIYTQMSFDIQLIGELGTTQYPFDLLQQEEVTQLGIDIYPIFRSSLSDQSENAKPGAMDGEFIDRIIEHFESKRPDLIHCHFTTGKIREALQVSKRMHIPLVVTCHGMTNLVPQYDSFVTGGLTTEEIISLLNSCAHTVVVSKPMFEFCKKKGLKNLSRIPGGIDMDYFCSNNHVQTEGILYVGKLNKHKGLRETLIAFLNIERQVNDHLYLVGRGTNKEIFEETGFLLDANQKKDVSQLIKNGRIHALGELLPDDLRELYRRCKLLVLPSLSEGFPIAILEALACGKPVVASDVGSISDVIEHGKNGFLISKGNTQELAKAILRILKYQAPLPKTCRDSVAKFEINKLAEKYKVLFEHIVQCRREGLPQLLAGRRHAGAVNRSREFI